MLAGCQSPLSTLEPAGPGAAAISGLWWLMFWASLAILAFMVAISLYAALRGRGKAGRPPARLLIIGGGLVFPGVTITALLVYGIAAGHSFLAVPDDGRAFRVEITGHQWWWEVRYPDGPGGAALYDANELHIPARRPVDVHITTADVIHSFWVPRLGGKLDAIPGITNVLRIEADAPGVYRGVCAEFCGAQHARMGFIVHAHEAEELETRLAEIAARTPGAAAQDMPGADAFAVHCAECHSVDSGQGEPRTGPNLAGVARRSHLGAAWMPNEDGALRRWLREHQQIKPGNRMPVTDHIPDAELDAIVIFLEALR
jgi:cytochrome c oxidase subunit II